MARTARIERSTSESTITVEVNLDGTGVSDIATGVGFYDHMLEQIAAHGGFSLRLSCEGDLHTDPHHTIEDSAIALGQALKQALGERKGIARYGFVLPMDETLATVALDFSGRPYLAWEGSFQRERVGDLPTELVAHFFRSLCDAAGLNLHLRVQGDNDHHKIEASFKGLARALRQAITRQGDGLPSTKGVL